MAYIAIGDPARWQADNRRGDTHSVLAAMTTDGYLPCTGIKRGSSPVINSSIGLRTACYRIAPDILALEALVWIMYQSITIPAWMI